MSLAIGIDLGGTNIKAALIDGDSSSLIASISRPTLDGEFVGDEPRFAHTVRDIVHELEAKAGQGKLCVGLSAPGLAHRNGRCIDWMPGRMHGLEKLDWSAFLGREARVLNDAHAALLGEVWIGAAKGCQDVFMITLGTGVGGAVLSEGRLLKGHIGRGGHLGHITVDANAPKDIFNTPGSLESFLGNKTLQERGAGKYENTHVLVAAAAAGDAEAQTLWLESVRYLAVGIVSLVNVLDPELVILGGGIASGAGDQLMQPLQSYLDDFEWAPGGHRIRIALATAGEWAGAYGCVYHCLNR
ncbi:ROK family protein [Brevifollis gellanilyticus]|uniref:Glucokinase n=1 Tax=Brevifollis gellanilyticus TaxID=748831 RepID=A0A512MHA4_9BACT|nr:ROK family protein [Brevifollis gellanilyticus]GEP46115.1 glucokinase [Brevifollis gellanilyticus]